MPCQLPEKMRRFGARPNRSQDLSFRGRARAFGAPVELDGRLLDTYCDPGVSLDMSIDDGGAVINPKFRDYHLPSFADVPRTEVYFADTSDALGPIGAKSMSESPYNPVAAALGNALADATGIRFTAVPFKPDRLWPLLHEKFRKPE